MSSDPKTRTLTGQRLPPPLQFELLAVTGAIKGTRFVLKKPVIRIGSHMECDVFIRDEFASRGHCEIRTEADGHYIQDLDSRNGTFVDGVKVKQARLNPGSLIRVGQTDLFYHVHLDESLPATNSDRFGQILGHSKAMQ